MRWLALTLMLQAATPQPAQVIITSPDWQRRPTGEDVARVYPVSAQRKNLPGRATIQCSVTANGTLANCEVVEELPSGEGFGDAALRLASHFRMRPLTRGGQHVAGGTVRIPLRFVVSEQMDPLSAMLGCYGQAAAAAEKDPSNSEAVNAYGFFAAQAALLEAKAKASPEVLEGSLRAARVAALTASARSLHSPDLKACLEFVRTQAAQQSLR